MRQTPTEDFKFGSAVPEGIHEERKTVFTKIYKDLKKAPTNGEGKSKEGSLSKERGSGSSLKLRKFKTLTSLIDEQD